MRGNRFGRDLELPQLIRPRVTTAWANSIGGADVNNFQHADVRPTKMIQPGKNTRSTIIAKGISAGRQ